MGKWPLEYLTFSTKLYSEISEASEPAEISNNDQIQDSASQANTEKATIDKLMKNFKCDRLYAKLLSYWNLNDLEDQMEFKVCKNDLPKARIAKTWYT